MQIFKIVLLSISVICASCAREGVISQPRNSNNLEVVRTFFSTPQIAPISRILAESESLVCIIYPGGSVAGALPSTVIKSALLTFSAPWIASDSYWTLVIFDTERQSPVRAVAIERSLISDIASSNQNRTCIESKDLVTIRSTPNGSYSRLTSF